jgi:arylsulfatase A-like enzyme
MKTVFVLFDSLNRKALSCYGGKDIETPNFQRLANRSVVFDNHYVGSLPCMPARRDLHTGRLNFLHRGWGPLEPFDHSFAALLHKEKKVYSHLISDHFHYWGDGGATYHNRYDTYDFIRGQEGDPWKAMVDPPWKRFKEMYHPVQYSEQRRNKLSRNIINREHIKQYEDFPSVRCFDAGLEFLNTNQKADNWLLHLETFDPHEPFHAPEEFRKKFSTNYKGPTLDWPPYARVTETFDDCEELRANYAAIIALCDHELGRLLDHFDAHDLWQDTALIVTTDHGFLLGEHDWWAKNIMPCYNEVAHIPLFIHHPDFASQAGTRRELLTQTMDIMPTLMDIFSATPPAEVTASSLLPALGDTTVKNRDACIYGVFGSAVNVTDGQYTCFIYPPDVHGGDLNQYTLMPLHMKEFFSIEELQEARLMESMPFSRSAPVLKIPATPKSPFYNHQGPGTLKDTQSALFDLLADLLMYLYPV